MKSKNLAITFLMLILCSSLVLGFGVSSKYFRGYPLEAYPGQTLEYSMIIDNVIGNQEAIVTAEIVTGEDIATLKDRNPTYTVPAGAKVNVPMIITIPEGGAVGGEYAVEVKFSPDTSADGGGIQIATGAQRLLPIKVVERPAEVEISQVEQGFPTSLLWLLLILLLIIVAYWYYTKKKKK
ncbi:hypothetical protein GOV04_01790 [Candidatus Woesearchaeota archaeon]|nr:hypothetical protein [Candidatus Woesearchaeota archaeon]